MDDAQLKTVWQQRQATDSTAHLSMPISMLVRRTLAKRVKQLSKLAAVWDELIPRSIRDHTALESMHSGVLTVMVDSSSHRFQLQTLLAGGLLRELQARLPVGLDRIKLVPGQFYSVDVSGSPRYQF